MQNTANVQNAKLYFEPTYCEISYKYHKIAFGLLTAFKHRCGKIKVSDNYSRDPLYKVLMGSPSGNAAASHDYS